MNGTYSSDTGDNDMEMRLWDYIDGFSDPSEKVIIEGFISENIEWRNKYKELLQMHQSINMTELEQPSMRFAKNVMEEIARHQIAPATKTYINQKIIWSIGAFFIAMIVGYLAYGISQINWSAGNSNKSTGIYFTQIDYSGMFNNSLLNAFMMVNVILGLMLFDRYLNSRKKKFQDQF
jgi:hypothetical protein